MPATRYRRRRKLRPRVPSPLPSNDSEKFDVNFSDKEQRSVDLLLQRFGDAQPTADELAAFIATIPDLYELTPDDALVLLAIVRGQNGWSRVG
jgi:hypothetical protein